MRPDHRLRPLFGSTSSRNEEPGGHKHHLPLAVCHTQHHGCGRGHTNGTARRGMRRFSAENGLGETYQKKAAMVYLSPADMKSLQIRDGDPVEMTSESGSVVVAAESDDDCKEGTGHMPLRLYSNYLASYDPSLSPLPNLKLIEARAF